jgi:hypothetical protein
MCLASLERLIIRENKPIKGVKDVRFIFVFDYFPGESLAV